MNVGTQSPMTSRVATQPVGTEWASLRSRRTAWQSGWRSFGAVIVAFCGMSAVLAAEPKQHFTFRDVASDVGLLPDVGGINGHATGWGDVDGDGWEDLYVGTFDRPGSKPNMLFRNREGRFDMVDTPAAISTRATGALFADLDNDGDLDLYVSSMPGPAGSKLAERSRKPIRGNSLFRNDDGRFFDVSADNGACPLAFGGRSATVLDFDGDGFLDLLVGEDPIPGYNGSKTSSSRLFRNLGKLQFEDVTQAVGIPADIPGLGVAAADVNDDGWPDLCITATSGSHLFLNDGRGQFTEAPGSPETFAYEGTKGDNMVCGCCFGDVDGDGRLDLWLGQHFSDPWVDPVPNKLFLNRGDGRFEEVTKAAGLPPLPLKAPHVEMQDFDNDGRVDLFTSQVRFVGDTPHPLVFKNVTKKAGEPRFETTALDVNEFPTAEHRAIKRSGTFFDRMLEEKLITYAAPAPTADFDNDGRLDVFVCSWWAEQPSMLLRNETVGGHWLQVRIDGGTHAAGSKDAVNRMGIGSRVNVYRAGGLGDATQRLGTREIAKGYGYASAQPAVAHFGLGDVERVDVEVVLPHGRGRIVRESVAADQRLTLQRK